MIRDRVPEARSLLDVACGTGWHLERLREWYEVEGLDYSPGMLRYAGARLPGVALHQADMRSFDLGRTFDVVTCLSSSIAWMRTPDDLSQAIGTMARHLTPGGLLVIEPWDFPEEAASDEPWVTTAEAPDRRVALMETTVLEGDTWVQETHYLDWAPERGIEHWVDTQELGAFSKADYVASLEEAGLGVDFESPGLLGRGLFLTRPR
jgi:SAM-dependent methyltransferase